MPNRSELALVSNSRVLICAKTVKRLLLRCAYHHVHWLFEIRQRYRGHFIVLKIGHSVHHQSSPLSFILDELLGEHIGSSVEFRDFDHNTTFCLSIHSLFFQSFSLRDDKSVQFAFCDKSSTVLSAKTEEKLLGGELSNSDDIISPNDVMCPGHILAQYNNMFDIANMHKKRRESRFFFSPICEMKEI
jgi:hypothetical protein